MARVNDAVGEVNRYLDDDGVFAGTPGAAPEGNTATPATTAEPLALLLLHALRSVTRAAAYRLHWRWRRLRRRGARLREEFWDLKQLEIAARRDQSCHALDDQARATRARDPFD
jgi:hypothetical protein